MFLLISVIIIVGSVHFGTIIAIILDEPVLKAMRQQKKRVVLGCCGVEKKAIIQRRMIIQLALSWFWLAQTKAV